MRGERGCVAALHSGDGKALHQRVPAEILVSLGGGGGLCVK